MNPHASDETLLVFKFFNEVGILSQLSLAEFRNALGRDLNTSEFGVLNHFVRVGDGVTPGDLARIFQVTKPSMTAIVRKLEEKGFVSVAPHAEDGRSKIVSITEKGRLKRDAAIRCTAPFAKKLINEFGADQLEAAMPHLTALREYLDEVRNERERQPKDD